MMTQQSVQACWLLLLSTYLFLPSAVSRTTTVRGPPPSILSRENLLEPDWDASSELGRRSQSLEQVGVDECPSNAIVRETCQVCVKYAKMFEIYPACCRNKRNARQWCELWLAYGLN